MSSTLTVNDLSNIINIIDVCSQRGAFKATELKGIGTVYERLTNIHASIVKPEEKSTDKLESVQEDSVAESKPVKEESKYECDTCGDRYNCDNCTNGVCPIKG